MKIHSHTTSQELKPETPKPNRDRGPVFALAALAAAMIVLCAVADARLKRAGAEYDATLNAVLLDLANGRISVTALSSRIDAVEASVKAIEAHPKPDPLPPIVLPEPKPGKPIARAHHRRCRPRR